MSMAEAAQEQQQTEQAEQLGLSLDDRFAKAAGLATPAQEEERAEEGDRQRDDKGRFVGQQAEGEQLANKDNAVTEGAKAEEEQEYKWDELKAIKLKIPMKQGDKEWEDEISLEQLREERMLKADYTRKQQELAEQRRQTETMTQQAVEKERTAYLSTLEALQESIIQAASPELASVDWNKLAQENPAEYVRLSNRAREVNAALERVRFEQEKVQHQQAKERDERLAKAVAESQTKLREAIPNWSDDLYTALQKRGTDTYGFKAEEIGQVWDHRVMQVLHDAHQFRLLKEQKPKTEETVKTLPPVLKPGAHKPKVNQQAQEFQKSRERLRANPRDTDAATDVMRAFVTPSR